MGIEIKSLMIYQSYSLQSDSLFWDNSFAPFKLCYISTFTFRQQVIIDPEEKEESIINGKLMMAFNIHNEVCCVQMNGGVCVDYEQVYKKFNFNSFFYFSDC